MPHERFFKETKCRRPIGLIYLVGMLIFFCSGKALAESSGDKVDYSSYVTNIERVIKHNWHPPKLDHTCKPTVFFKVSKTGEITSEKIVISSGNAQMDQAALEAVKSVGNFPPPPGKEEISIEFAFEYNARRGLHTNWDNLWHFENAAYDLMHFDTYQRLAEDLGSGNLNRFLYHFGPILFILALLAVFAFYVYYRIMPLFRYLSRPEQQVIPVIVSEKLGIKQYPIQPVNWERLCRTPNVNALVVMLISLPYLVYGLKDYWGPLFLGWVRSDGLSDGYINLLGIWHIPNLQFYFWGGLLMFMFGCIFVISVPRYFRKLKEITAPPGTQSIVTLNNDWYKGLTVRIENYTNGRTAEPKWLYVRNISPVRLPEQLPFTDKAEVFFDQKTNEPVALRICGGLFYIYGSPFYRKMVFMPWKN